MRMVGSMQRMFKMEFGVLLRKQFMPAEGRGGLE